MNAQRFCEVMKVLRTTAMTIDEIRLEAGVQPNTAVVWTRELVAQGILVSRTGCKPDGRRGVAPAVYAVAPAWGGVA